MALALEQANDPVRVARFMAAEEGRMAARIAEKPEPCVMPLAKLVLAKEPA
jgi:hypothetical protein